MVLQKVILPDEVCQEKQMYFRLSGQHEMTQQHILLTPHAEMSSDTYMNTLDIGHWKQYTEVENLYLRLKAKGHFEISYMLRHNEETIRLSEQEYICDEANTICCSIPNEIEDGLFFFKIKAIEQTEFSAGEYFTDQNQKNEVRLAVNICTYHRREQLQRNLSKLTKSQFTETHSELYGCLRIYVTDNGDDFCYEGDQTWMTIRKNSNIGGGTGGFTRGLQEIIAHRQEYDPTHVIFMDDDVEFQMESFYRLYAFLAFVKSEYADCGIAGRMFRMDKRSVQYTAAEKWNHGNILHIDGSYDMAEKQNVMEEKTHVGEYGGWWLCVYPAVTFLKQKPFPFFLHCDDVEYGLRQGKPLLILRGFQVWHETYECRMRLPVLYYDIRNAAIVNILQGETADADQLIREWKKRMDHYHNLAQWEEKYICTLALWHLGKIRIFQTTSGKLPSIQEKLCRRTKTVKMITPVFHRVTKKYIQNNFGHIAEYYKNIREEMRWL